MRVRLRGFLEKLEDFQDFFFRRFVRLMSRFLNFFLQIVRFLELRNSFVSSRHFLRFSKITFSLQFLNYQRNNQTIVYRLMDVANQVDWVSPGPVWPAPARSGPTEPPRSLFQFYRPLKVRVALTGLEVWSDRDKIRVERSATDTLNNFLEWRSRELLPRLRHDNAQLIMYAFKIKAPGLFTSSRLWRHPDRRLKCSHQALKSLKFENLTT